MRELNFWFRIVFAKMKRERSTVKKAEAECQKSVAEENLSPAKKPRSDRGRAVQRVGVFGSSLDPPTGRGGHFSIVEYFAKEVFDKVLVLPVFEHIFDEKRGKLAPFEHRVALAKLCFKDIDNAEVCIVEEELNRRKEDPSERIGMIDVLEYLKATRSEGSECEYALILGADTFRDLSAGKWKESDEILKTTQIAVIDRPGQPRPGVSPLVNVKHFQVPEMKEISSTVARQACSEMKWEVALDSLLPDVVMYIKAHDLYSTLSR